MRKRLKEIRLVIETDKETHILVKNKALAKNMSIRGYVLQAIAEKIVRDKMCGDELYEN